MSLQINAQNKDFVTETKVLDEFILRFNFNDTLYSNDSLYFNNIWRSLKVNKNAVITRDLLLRSLFDHCNKTFLNDTSLLLNFIQIVNSKHIFINLLDMNNYALVKCTFESNGNKKKNFDFDLILQYVGNDKKGYKWIVVSVDSPYFDQNEKSQWTINPANNDIDFMDLYRLCNDGGYMNLVDEKFKPDKISMFLSMLKNQSISLKTIKSVQYHFLQIDGYIFTIDYFNRNNCNEGWLISSLIRVNNNDKNIYKRNILHLDVNCPRNNDTISCKKLNENTINLK